MIPASRRLSRRRRLCRGADYRRVLASPVKSSDRFFTVFGRLQEKAPGAILDRGDRPLTRSQIEAEHAARLGLAISRRCAGRAVDRHRIKRVIREGFRHDDFGRCPIDIVVICRQAAVGAENAALRRSMQHHLSRLRKIVCAGSSD